MFFILSLLLFFSALSIFFTRNTIYSIFYLILCFFFSSLILIQFGLDYIPLVFINIYIGALSVLFIFVIMMLNIKIYGNKNTYLFIFLFLTLVLLFGYFEFYNNFLNLNFIHQKFIINKFFIKLNPLESIGGVLFVKYYTYIILSSFILFIAMLGSVTLVFSKKIIEKNQKVYKQITKSYNNSFFKIV